MQTRSSARTFGLWIQVFRRPFSPEDENVLSFTQSAPKGYTTAINLVHQAAEIFNGMESHAREAEARPSRCARAWPRSCSLPKISGCLGACAPRSRQRAQRQASGSIEGLAAGSVAYRECRGSRDRRGVSRAGGRDPVLQGQSGTRRVDEVIRKRLL